MYNLFVTYTAPDKNKIREFYQAIIAAGVKTATDKEAESLFYEYYFSVERENELLLIEKWTDKSAQAYHDTLPHLKKLEEIKPKYAIETKVEEF
ncbi:MAG: putative quinol monooxygenase [Suipraeoptans sp.]